MGPYRSIVDRKLETILDACFETAEGLSGARAATIANVQNAVMNNNLPLYYTAEMHSDVSTHRCLKRIGASWPIAPNSTSTPSTGHHTQLCTNFL